MATASHREEIWVPGMPEPISHFVHVVRAGRLVFVSGCVASDDKGRTVGGSDIVARIASASEPLRMITGCAESRSTATVRKGVGRSSKSSRAK